MILRCRPKLERSAPSQMTSPEKWLMAKMACKGSQPRHWGVQIQTGKRARPKGRGSSGRSIPLRPAKRFRAKLKRWRFKSPSMTISTEPKRKAWSFCSATYVAGAGSGVIGLDPYPKQVHSLDAVGQDLHFHQTRSSKRTERYFHAQGLTGLSPGLAFAKELKRGPYRAGCDSIEGWGVTWHGRASCRYH